MQSRKTWSELKIDLRQLVTKSPREAPAFMHGEVSGVPSTAVPIVRMELRFSASITPTKNGSNENLTHRH